MKRRLTALFTAFLLLLTCTPCASAAADTAELLTQGGYIRLAEDLSLSGSITLTKNTVLDLNGHTITGSADIQSSGYASLSTITVPAGVSLSVKCGTLKNVKIVNNGYIPYLDSLSVSAPKGINLVSNYGRIDTIQRCVMTAAIRCVDNLNAGTIGLVYDCDLTAKDNYSAIQNSGGCTGSIEVIRHCRIRGSEKTYFGYGFGAGSTAGPVLIEDSILLGHGNGGIRTEGAAITARNCTIINSADVYGDGGLAMYVIFPESTPYPVLEDCTIIANLGACGGFEGTYDVDRHYVEYADITNCTFLTLDEAGSLRSHLNWEMESTLPVPYGLSHFTQTANYTPGQFIDLPETHWGTPSIARAVELGLMAGTGTGFQPDGTVTLAQTITMAARLHSIYHNNGEPFAPSTVWYQTFVDYALKNGILTTNYDNYNRPAKRHEFAAILAAALPAEALDAVNAVPDSSIPDIPMAHPSAAAIYTFYRAGILTGMDSAGSFCPELEINRAAAAVILTHLADPNLRVVA